MLMKLTPGRSVLYIDFDDLYFRVNIERLLTSFKIGYRKNKNHVKDQETVLSPHPC